MIEPIQLDLFEDHQQGTQPILNGMYYEQSSGKFVSYVLGRRHFEVTPGRCFGDKEWKERIHEGTCYMKNKDVSQIICS